MRYLLKLPKLQDETKALIAALEIGVSKSIIVNDMTPLEDMLCTFDGTTYDLTSGTSRLLWTTSRNILSLPNQMQLAICLLNQCITFPEKHKIQLKWIRDTTKVSICIWQYVETE
jgi:hypothetical protein